MDYIVFCRYFVYMVDYHHQ